MRLAQGLSIFLATAAFAACASTHRTVTAARPTPSSIPVTHSAETATDCAEPPATEATKLRDAALDHFFGGDVHLAAVGFDSALRANPRDVGLYALHAAALSVDESSWAKTSSELTSVKPVTVADPLAAQAVHHLVTKPLDLPAGKLPAIGAPRESESGSDALEVLMREGFERPGQLGAGESASIDGLVLSQAFHTEQAQVFAFGDVVVGVRARDDDRMRLFDLLRPAGGATDRVTFGTVVGSALILSLSRSEPIKDGGAPVPWTPFLEAVDLATGEVQWISDAGVGVSNNFLVAGRYAFVGSRTAKGGSIDVVDLEDGSVHMQNPISFEPYYLFVRDRVVTALGADKRADLDVSSWAAPLPAELAQAGDPAREERTRCVIRRTLAALDTRDTGTALRELDALGGSKTPAIVALVAAANFIERAKNAPDSVVDLTAAKPVVVDPLHPAPRAAVEHTAAPKLRRLTGPVAKPHVKPGSPPRQPNEPYVMETDSLEASPGLEIEMPDTYGADFRVRSWKFVDGNLALYGDNVAVLDGTRTRQVLDLSKLLAARAPSFPRSMVEDINIRGSLLYVAINRSQSTSDALTSYVVAIDIPTGAIVWESSPIDLPTHLIRYGDFLLLAGAVPSAFFDRGPPTKAAIVVLSADTGVTVASAPLDGLPADFGYLARSADEANTKPVVAAVVYGNFVKFAIE